MQSGSCLKFKARFEPENVPFRRNLSFDFKKSDFILKLKQKTLLYNGTHAQRQTYVSATDKNQKESGFPSQCWEQLQRSFLNFTNRVYGTYSAVFLSDVNPAVSQFLLITLFSVSESFLLEIYLYIFSFLHAREPPQRLNSIRADEQSASEFKTEAL